MVGIVIFVLAAIGYRLSFLQLITVTSTAGVHQMRLPRRHPSIIVVVIVLDLFEVSLASKTAIFVVQK